MNKTCINQTHSLHLTELFNFKTVATHFLYFLLYSTHMFYHCVNQELLSSRHRSPSEKEIITRKKSPEIPIA